MHFLCFDPTDASPPPKTKIPAHTHTHTPTHTHARARVTLLAGGEKLYPLAVKLHITGFLTKFQKVALVGTTLTVAAGVAYAKM